MPVLMWQTVSLSLSSRVGAERLNRIYSSPFRVYLALLAAAVAGIYCGFKLPISLYPNSSKPTVWAGMSYGSQTAEEFLNTHGSKLERQLRGITAENVDVERVEGTYEPFEVEYRIEFKWGTDPYAAQREVRHIVNSFASRLPEQSRDSVWVWLRNRNAGFFALSFYSDQRTLDNLYDVLEPALMPQIANVKDAQDPMLWNPSAKQIQIELIPEAMASLQLLPKTIEDAVNGVLMSRNGGAVSVQSGAQLSVQMPRIPIKPEDLGRTVIPTHSGKSIHLADVARINFEPRMTENQSYKTSGTPSMILYVTPRAGGNVKKMSEDILAIVQKTMPSLPSDIHYKTLVDPSEFIRSAVRNVSHEVAIGALLAVAILFVFIGSLRNVVTAAIEIPLSMVLAFILMHLSGMNLNLISLGGLALSAGMNVDASVVVMENIFRHFNIEKPKDFAARLQLIVRAVREVAFPVIASTISSIVVFLPLAFTSDLSYAVLGDLAKTVVFSHSFSAIVALILVPTVRLHLLSKEQSSDHKAPIESHLKKLEHWYSEKLLIFMEKPLLKWGTYGGLAIGLVLLAVLVLPRLEKEIIGRPDTDWIVLDINTRTNTLTRQMETAAEEIEARLLTQQGSKIQYTFTQVHGPNNAGIMARLRNKKEMRKVWKQMEEKFTNSPMTTYHVQPWNPSELPIPDPPHLQIAVRGGEAQDRADIASALDNLLEEHKVFPRIWTEPPASRRFGVLIEPNLEQWIELTRTTKTAPITPSDLADIVLVATQGRRIGHLPMNNQLTPIVIAYPRGELSTYEDVAALPLGINSKLIPLKALASVKLSEVRPTIFRKDGRELYLTKARENMGEEYKAKASLAKAQVLVADWQKTRSKSGNSTVSVAFEDPAKDMNEAIHQLGIAVGLSVLLIFLTLLIQFGSVAEPLLVLVSVPLGFIGVFVSLFVFRSTLSLNSVLGIILLNGIAVANSIILVDFIKRLVGEGISAKEAALQAARKRLRPILITSLTTILGMLPVAFGFGEGGKILQPLGIAVSGGLWVSTLLTLFLVPALHVSYLEWCQRQSPSERLRVAWMAFTGRMRRVQIPVFLRREHAATTREILS
ncbi:MAG: efflux RND transporter permease subunit [Deltaproteobacteria bacterium]|nr:efflux RND transporter permease subunit [Deltaproteobacteria bacterium]